MRVRPMTSSDAAVIASWGDAPRLGAAAAPLLHNLDLPAELARSVTQPWVVTDADDQPLAYALFWRVLDEAELVALATRPDRRRCGLARQLLEAALEALSAAGTRRVLLEVDAHNEAARRLYERLGFREFNRRRGYYDNGHDALELELVIAR